MGTPEEAARAIFGQRAPKYTTSACHTDPAVLARVVELSSPEPQWRVLDVGTGTGHTAFALAPHVATVIGIDLTPEMIREAEKLRGQRSITNVDFLIGDAHRLPFVSGAFDLITCRRTAHHFSGIVEALREMRRLLSTKGRVVIDDRSVPENDFVDACMNTLDRYHDGSHVRQYRPSEWRRMLEELGFVVEEVGPYVKHRPLTSLTDGVSEDNVAKIHEVLNRLNGRQKEALNLVEKDGELYLNHWYVMVAARRDER